MSNEKLKEDLSASNVLSYAEACNQVFHLLVQLKENGYERLIIPSRGAYPFYSGALTSAQLHLKSGIEFHKFHSHFNTWFLPFTSDWGEKDISLQSGQIRKFWAKVLADCIRNEHSVFMKYYHSFIDLVGAGLTINTTDLKLNKAYKVNNTKDEKFIFIDTAKSGRAISEIVDAFNDFNLKNYFIILLVDEDGQFLLQDYKRVIEKERSQGNLALINVAKIFSEDTTPLLNSGISSLVFPSVIESALYGISEFKDAGFSGGGLWFIDSASELTSSIPQLNGIRGLVHSAISSGIKKTLDPEIKWYEDLLVDNTIHAVEEIERIGVKSIYHPNLTKKIVLD